MSADRFRPYALISCCACDDDRFSWCDHSAWKAGTKPYSGASFSILLPLSPSQPPSTRLFYRIVLWWTELQTHAATISDLQFRKGNFLHTKSFYIGKSVAVSAPISPKDSMIVYGLRRWKYCTVRLLGNQKTDKPGGGSESFLYESGRKRMLRSHSPATCSQHREQWHTSSVANTSTNRFNEAIHSN
jgi:hypothetical protein